MNKGNQNVSTEDLVRQDILERQRRQKQSDKRVRMALFLLFCLVGLVVIGTVLVMTFNSYR